MPAAADAALRWTEIRARAARPPRLTARRPVEQRFRSYVVSSGLDEPSMQRDEVGYAEEIWHALENGVWPPMAQRP